MAELGQALGEPKLYRKLEGTSDLAELSRVLPSLPQATRPAIDSRLVRPLLAYADAKGTPRKVRKAIREALGRKE